MARTGAFMQITPVDSDFNLFRVEDVFSQDLVQQVLTTDWANLPWCRQEGQESWPRRKIDNSALPWIQDWDQECSCLWPKIQSQTRAEMNHYQGTAFWLDEPGFTCNMHTDGELPGSMQLTWIGAKNLGTTFYWYKDINSLRYQTPFESNSGYIMINRADAQGYRRLMWHAMLTAVPANTFRITSYSVGFK